MEIQCPICGNGPSTISNDPEDLALLNQFTINLCHDTGDDLIDLKPEDFPCSGCISMLTAYLEGKRRIQGESIKVELNGVQLLTSQLDTSVTSVNFQKLASKALIQMNRKLENLKKTKSNIERVISQAKSSLISEFSSDINASGACSGGEESTPVVVNVVSENPESDQAAVEVKEEESEAIVESEVYIHDPLNTDGDDDDKQQNNDNIFILTTSSIPSSSSPGSSLQLRRASKIKKTIAQLQNRHRMVTRNASESNESNDIANAQLNFLRRNFVKGGPGSRFRICDVCGKCCSSKSNLTQHIRNTHLKLNVRVCTKCGASFNCNSNYKAHQMRVHKEVF